MRRSCRAPHTLPSLARAALHTARPCPALAHAPRPPDLLLQHRGHTGHLWRVHHWPGARAAGSVPMHVCTMVAPGLAAPPCSRNYRWHPAPPPPAPSQLTWFVQPYVQRLRYEPGTGTVEATTLTLLAQPRVDRFHLSEVRTRGGRGWVQRCLPSPVQWRGQQLLAQSSWRASLTFGLQLGREQPHPRRCPPHRRRLADSAAAEAAARAARARRSPRRTACTR